MVVTTGIVERKPKQNIITIGKASRDSRARSTIQQLLPGIPDDITIIAILPKLSWAMLRTFSVVSRRWLQAFQDGSIFEARVSANSTETMFVFCVDEAEGPRFALYSVREDSVYSLPPIPGIPSGTSVHSKLIYTSVNGRLYVFIRYGMKSGSSSPIEKWSNFFTYEYDLARQRGWRQRSAPEVFWGQPSDSAVMNGKIFVHGMAGCFALYDPDADVWSPLLNAFPRHGFLPPITIMAYHDGPHQKVLSGTGIKEDLVYHHGIISHSCQTMWKPITNFELNASNMSPFFSFPIEIHSRSAEQEVKSGRGIAVVLIDGSFLKLTRQHIDAYDSHTNTWTPVHFEGPFEFIDLDPTLKGFDVRWLPPSGTGVAVVRNKNEMYSVVRRWGDHRTTGRSGYERKLFLMKSEKLIQGSELEKDSSTLQNVTLGRWKQLKCNLPLSEGFLRCPMQL